MGTGYVRNDTGNNIADGNVINASDLDGEFDALVAAFNASTGHSHDGTTGEGPQIDTAGLADDAVTGAKIDSTTTVTAASFVGPLTGNVTGDLTGNADTATALETARTIGGVSFNGTANINLPGVNTSGNQDTTGNAATATALETARTIAGQSFDGTANISIAPGNLTGVTASAAELNILDGATVTTAEVNILDGATVTTAEINKLDGVTATTTELNYLDITTLGTSQASKAVTADANGVVTFDNGVVEDSTALSGTSVTINLRDGNNFTHTLSGNTTYTFSNPGASGRASAFTLKVVQDSTDRTITWPASVDWAAATAPTLSSGSGAVDYFVFITTDGGTTYYGFVAGQALATPA